MSHALPPSDPLRRSADEAPDRPRLAPYRVEGPRCLVWICSPWMCRTFVHYDGYRTIGCSRGGEGTHCPGCDRGWGVRVQNWLQVFDAACTTRVVQLLSLTDLAAEHDPLLWSADGRLDGRGLFVWRTPAYIRGRLYARLHQGEQLATVPPVPDTLTVLHRMWGGRTQRRGKSEELN